MAPSKSEVLSSGTVSNQQALVKKIIARKREPRRIIIPGGKNMLESLDGRNLQQAVHTWLRGCRWFDSVKLSFVTDLESRESTTYRIHEFPDAPSNMRAWDMPSIGGKLWLAGLIAETITERIVFAIEAKDDGLYVTVPTEEISGSELQSSDAWQPYLDFVVRGKGEYSIH